MILTRAALFAAAAAAAAALAAPAFAGPRLAPAEPQPDAAALTPGLSVRYAYPADVKRLSVAADYLGRVTEAGPPLAGLDYPDTEPGGLALTSRQAERVVAGIEGYLHFDAPGTWRLQFWSNDGLEVRLGGAEVYRHDGRHPCTTEGWMEVEVPEAGWYPLDAVWFQRMNTSCLMLRRQAPDETEAWTDISVYGHEAD